MIGKMEFGNTGHMSTRLLFGGAAFYSTNNRDDVQRTMDLVMEAGINHIDTASGYGESEKMLGPWLKHNKKHVFLATKTDKRSYKEAKEEFQKSLELMCVDSVDLLQMHCLINPEEWETAMNRDNGALRAFTEAKDQGLIRFLGVTAHGMEAAAMNLKSLKRYPFDSVLLPYNYPMMQNIEYKADFEKLSVQCKEKKIALQLIKTVCKGPWPKGVTTNLNTWYEPLTEQEHINKAIGWALNQSHGFINSLADITILPKVIKAMEIENNLIDDEQMSGIASELGLKNLFA